jgi:hypothetical protein
MLSITNKSFLLSVIRLNVVMLSVVMLNVAAPIYTSVFELRFCILMMSLHWNMKMHLISILR